MNKWYVCCQSYGERSVSMDKICRKSPPICDSNDKINHRDTVIVTKSRSQLSRSNFYKRWWRNSRSVKRRPANLALRSCTSRRRYLLYFFFKILWRAIYSQIQYLRKPRLWRAVPQVIGWPPLPLHSNHKR